MSTPVAHQEPANHLPAAVADLLECLDEALLLVDGESLHVVHANGRAAEVTGRGIADLLGPIDPSVATADDRPARWNLAEDDDARWFDVRVRRATLEGHPWLLLAITPAPGPGEMPNELWLQLAFEQSPQGMSIVADDGRFVKANPALARLFGLPLDSLVGKSIRDVLHPEEVGEHDAILDRLNDESGEPMQLERRFLHADGRTVWLRATGSRLCQAPEGPCWHVVQWEDQTERHDQEQRQRVLEAQLRRSQRMEAVARLAGGIAHDFNNMLAIILNYADFARRLAPDGRSRDYLDAIRKGALRAASLTRQLLIFGRRDTAMPEVLELNAIVKDIERLLRRTLGEDVELIANLDPGVGHVWLALPHAEQVIMNLAVNSRDAMPQGGRLTLTTDQVTISPEEARQRVDVTPGDYVRLTMQDTGKGMDDEVLAKAFEPFFTTKEPGEGTGLGLSMVYGIVQDAGGWIDVKSAPGIGTTIMVYLPVTERELEEDLEYASAPPQGRGETVLVVEDEPGVRALTVQILRENGYQVSEADGPETALELCRKRDEPFDLLLTDVIMPHMSGADLANLIRATWRRTKVLFMSGYAGERLDPYRAQHADVVLLQKPFNGDDLLYGMRRVLDEDE